VYFFDLIRPRDVSWQAEREHPNLAVVVRFPMVIRAFRVVFGSIAERSWLEVFGSEKAGWPFRRSETRRWSWLAPFRHPSLARPGQPPVCSQDSRALRRQWAAVSRGAAPIATPC